jgi:hypothetical protein
MRKNLALVAIATAAVMSIATSPPRTPPLFEGAANAEGPNFLVSAERSDWRFRVEAELELPPEAEQEGFESSLIVDMMYSGGELSTGLVDCDENVLIDDGADNQLVITDVFADCAPSEPCSVSVCLEVAGDGSVEIPVQWWAEAHVRSFQELDESEQGLEIPITLTLTEEPVGEAE